MYALEQYGRMITDTMRMDAYAEALRRVVTPDSVVLDIGAGTGIMSLLAARLGARRVYAVEPNPLVHVAARVAVENRLADRIQFIQGRSQQIELSEKADIVVCDLRGVLPYIGGHVEAIVDARRRLMKPTGTLIPLRDVVRVAPVEAADAYHKIASPWDSEPRGFRMTAAAQAALNSSPTSLTSVDQLLGAPQLLATLKYQEIEDPNLDATVVLPIERSGSIHGMLVWFVGELIDGVEISTAPDRGETVYSRAFFPLSEPKAVNPGDHVHVRLKALLLEGTFCWIWGGRIMGPDDSTRSSFQLSSALHHPPSAHVREIFEEECAPALSTDGRMMLELLQGIDGGRSVAEHATSLATAYPERFGGADDASAFVRKVLERYGEATLRVSD